MLARLQLPRFEQPGQHWPIPFLAPDFWPKFRRRLRDRRFWIVQAMIGGVTASHVIGEAILSTSDYHLGAAYFIPASISFFPVLYASLNFGREGAVPTAIWTAFLAFPNIVIWHSGVERAGETFQVSLMILMAVVVAGKVDRETAARRKAEELEVGLRASEFKYRALFDSAGEACLVVESNGTIREANSAATRLFGQSVEQLKGSTVSDLPGGCGPSLLKVARQGHGTETEIEFPRPGGGELYIQPICTRVPTREDGVLLQVLFRDVTDRRHLHDFAREVVRAQEHERQRIAEQLECEVVQSIVALCWHLDGISRTGVEVFPASIAATVGEVRNAAEGIGDELRRFARDLRPSILDDLGLVAAVRRLVAELSERTAVRGQLIVEGAPRRLGSTVEVSLFRIAQEALRNVERHAGASDTTVRMTFGRGVRLVVSDNGRGFQLNPSNTTGGGRLGLLGMHERARLIGGTCRIASRPGRGTRVEVRVPAETTGRQSPAAMAPGSK